MSESLDAATSRRFKAFISYSHAADGKFAPALQHALQAFAKPWYALRACRVFRDETGLAVNSALWPAIERALLDSEYFVLLASPAAAQSHWVQREVESWCAAREASRILILLTDGELSWDATAKDFDWTLTTALPATLAKRYEDEPLYLDVRWVRQERHVSRSHPQFAEIVADLSATLRGLDKDTLIGQDVREHRRTRRVVQAAVAVLLVLTVAAIASFIRARSALMLAERRQVELAVKLEDLGNICVKNRDLECAQKALDQDLETSRDLYAQFPKSAEHEKGLAVALVQAGEMMFQGGDLKRARVSFSEAVGLIRKRTPVDDVALRDLSVALLKLGDVDVARREASAARQSFDEALRLRRRLLAGNPADAARQRDVAVLLGRIGTANFQLQDYAAGLPPMKEAIGFYDALASRAGATAADRRELAINLYDLAGVQINLEQWSDAKDNLLRSIELQRRENAQSPMSVQRAELFQALRRAGLVLLRLNDVRAAPLHREACVLARTMPDNIPDEELMSLILDLEQIAEAHFTGPGHDPGTASECVADALRRAEILAVANPSAFESPEMQAARERLRQDQGSLRPPTAATDLAHSGRR